MDDQGYLADGKNTALVILAFLQADCSPEYRQELHSLGQEINLNVTRDINFNGPRKDALDEGDLECDGHLPTFITADVLGDLQPSVDLQRPGE